MNTQAIAIGKKNGAMIVMSGVRLAESAAEVAKLFKLLYKVRYGPIAVMKAVIAMVAYIGNSVFIQATLAIKAPPVVVSKLTQNAVVAAVDQLSRFKYPFNHKAAPSPGRGASKNIIKAICSNTRKLIAYTVADFIFFPLLLLWSSLFLSKPLRIPLS